MIKKCPICNKEFKTNSNRQVYCCKDCKQTAENERKRKARLKEKKCKYCGKTFIGNDKTVYCSKDCAKYAKLEYDESYHRNRWYHDEVYRQVKTEKQIGTINLQDNLDEDGNRDWEKEARMIKALKKKAGLTKRSGFY